MQRDTFLKWHAWLLLRIVDHIQIHVSNGEAEITAVALAQLYVSDMVFMFTPQQQLALEPLYGHTEADVKLGLLETACHYLGIQCTIYRMQAYNGTAPTTRRQFASIH